MKSKEFLNYFQNKQQSILNSIREIVEIESPSRDFAGSLQVVGFLEAEARKTANDFIIKRISAESYGEHFLLHAFQSNEKPILLLGHTDTVHPRNSKEKNPTRIENNKFYGCGIFDMKANCVLMLEILRAFSELNLKPNRPITILLSCDEEIGSSTGRELVEEEARRAEFCLVCEPSANGKVKTGRKGTAGYTLKTQGVPAHAGLEPEKGASAILEISRQIERLHSFNNIEIGTTVNVCLVKGGTASNVIPENAECTIDVRFASISEAKRIENKIRSLKSFDEKVSLEVSGAINRPPLERTENVVKLYERAKQIAASFDYELGETKVGGASDGNFVGALGVPVLDGLGVAGNGAHTLEEYI
ncbi:MAG: M20 family metallopeptidase, partial [Acidobacteria bacterium]|nr:M20 family metallopeptidase [Acidobacteriota bacterium]MCA1640291.1 M20 family metallopeptidase [Acidobacteriota bacterium]